MDSTFFGGRRKRKAAARLDDLHGRRRGWVE
jgi:hypothetical protein